MADMHLKLRSNLALLMGIILVLTFGCRREFGLPGVENEILTPILSSKLSIGEIVPDSLQTTDGDGFVTLVYRNNIYTAGLGSFQEIETREFSETAKLQSLTLGAQSAERSISLGQVAQEMGAAGEFIISQNGNNIPIPPITGLIHGPIPVDGSEFFETVTLDSGYMDITIMNGFPTAMSNVEFEIRNESDNSLIGSQTFPSVAAGTTETQTIDLAGKTIEGSLIGNILNFDIDGTTSAVLIDTSDQVIVTVTVRDMKVHSATAIFPAQNIIEIGDTSAMENVGDLRITRAKARSGTINIRVVSTVEDTMYFEYFVPDGTKDGEPLFIEEKINPAPVGGSIEKVFQYSVDGYEFDLTGQPAVNHYNAFYSELTSRIDSTGRVVNLSLEDSILIYVQLSEFLPEYIEGYLGHTEAEFGPTSAPIDLFKHFESGTLEFEEVGVSLGVSNGNGVPFDVELLNLSAENTSTSNEVDIDFSGLPNPLSILGAADLSTPWEESWQLQATSSLNNALNIYPDQLNVALRVVSNPAQDSNGLNQFAVDTNTLDAYLDLDIPLSLIANDLVLSDTLPLSVGGIERLESIQGGTFYLVGKNGFPLEAELTVAFLSPDGQELVVSEFDGSMPALSTNQQSALSWTFDKEAFDQIRLANRAIVKAKLNTLSTTQHQRIYSDQILDLTLSARFLYNFAE